jgi:hypothetical protein
MSGSLSALVRNERLKLLASLLNTMAGTSVAVGVAAPIAAAFFYGGGIAPSVHAVEIGVIVWAATALVLHGAAQVVLGGLR